MATWLCPLLLALPFLLLMWCLWRKEKQWLAAHIAEITPLAEEFGFKHWVAETLDDFRDLHDIQANYLRYGSARAIFWRTVDGQQAFFADVRNRDHSPYRGGFVYAFDLTGDLPAATFQRRSSIKHRDGLSPFERRWRGKGDEFAASLAAETSIAETLCYDELLTRIVVNDCRVLLVFTRPGKLADYHSRLRIAMRLAEEFNRWASGEYARWQAMSETDKQAWGRFNPEAQHRVRR